MTNTKEIGAYNWMGLASSEIVFYNNTEYWVSPTTPTFPSTDWISEHLIYTHAAKVLVINTHTGAVVNATTAFGIPTEPLIYYGEGGGLQPERVRARSWLRRGPERLLSRERQITS